MMELRSFASFSTDEGFRRVTQLLFLDGIRDSQACDCAEPELAIYHSQMTYITKKKGKVISRVWKILGIDIRSLFCFIGSM